MRLHILAPVACTTLLACVGAAPPLDVPGDRVAVDVAPLTLTGITNATWRISVANADGQPVWSQDLTADAFGDGVGAVSYVGPCDAQRSPNTVSLALISLSDVDGPLTEGVDFVNPAPATAPLTRSAPCDANADTPVTFDVTVARAANQGFFDVAVNFRDVFCSAKLDCERAPGEPLRLLHGPDGERAPTAVLALACAGGTGQDVWLYLDDIALDCGGTSVSVDPSLGPGRLSAIDGANLPNAHLFDALVTTGDNGAVRYWNVALGLDDVAGCSLSATATASDSALAALATPDDTVWPVLSWELEDLAACTAHALGDEDGVVSVDYVGPAPVTFDHERGPDGGTSGPDDPDPAPQGTNCQTLYAADSTLPSDYYVIDPDGDGGVDPFEVYCDMVEGDGGWTLFAHQRDGIASGIVDVVSPDATAYGVVSDARWIALRDSMVDGMRFVDEAGRVSQISATKLESGRCTAVTTVDSIVPGVRTRLWWDEADCNGTGTDYSQIYLTRDATFGASLYAHSSTKFDVWGYGAAGTSYGIQNELLYYIR